MKIVIDIRPAFDAAGTGIGSYTLSFLRALLKLKTQHEIFLLSSESAELLPLPSNMTSITCPSSKKQAQIFITELLLKLAPHVFFLPQNGLHYPLEKNCRWVVTIHDLIPFVMPETVRRGYFSHFTKEVSQVSHMADRIISVSKSTANDLQKILRVPVEKIRVIPSGSAPEFQPAEKDECYRALKNRYPALEDPFLLYVGGLNPRKNVQFLIFAYSRICRYLQRPHQLVVAGGDQRHLPPLKMLVESVGIPDYVYFPGHIPPHDLPLFYNTASLFIYPSLYEGFGLPPLEAMSCGTPVMVSNSSSLSEVVGYAGKRFAPDDLLHFCRLLKDILENHELRQTMREKGLRRASLFQWNRLAKKILHALTEW